MVLVAAAAMFAWGVDGPGIAAQYADPVARVRAQDEAVYVNCAIRMNGDGDWLNPKVMGRLFLFKPPLLFWATAASIRAFGLSLLAVRLPAVLFGALGVAACFLWAARGRSLAAGILAAGVVAASPLWNTFSRLCYTDIPAAACASAALAAIALDARLQRRWTAPLAGALIGSSFLAKSVVAAIPVLAVLLWMVLLSREIRPPWRRLWPGAAMCAVVSIPWPVYQAVVHPQWFRADFLDVQLLGVGVAPAVAFAQSSAYYLWRMLEIDAAALLLGAAGLAGALLRGGALRREPAALLALCFLTASIAALLAFQARNLPYVLFVLPPLCVLGGMCGPTLLTRRAIVPAAALAALFAIRVAGAGEVWSLRPAWEEPEGAAAMRQYLSVGRGKELILVDTDDHFVSATLPLERVRYAFLDPQGMVARMVPHYVPLGITLTAREFARLPELEPVFRKRLRAWNYDTSEPIGTTVLLSSRGELAAVIAARPEADYYVSASWLTDLRPAIGRHRVTPAGAARVFLLSDLPGSP